MSRPLQWFLLCLVLLLIGAMPPAHAAAPCAGSEAAIAGFRLYQGRALWPLLEPGAALRLVREPANPFDALAVAVYWGEFKLGYVARSAGCALAESLDRGARLQARVSRQEQGPARRLSLRIVAVEAPIRGA
ncbi:MAG TPA: HIRAN domain-containing protein [Solimonas sp.]|nr:HIRAN domain-containing protein [Solimonas sp.]